MDIRLPLNPELQRFLPEGFTLHDPVLETAYEQRQQQEDARQARRLVRRMGSRWQCPGRCGRWISANKSLCSVCQAEKALAEWSGLR